MTHQLDLMPTNLVDAAVLERIDAQLPKTREVKAPRLPLDACMHPVDALKAAGVPMNAEQEAQMRAVCDEPVNVTAIAHVRYPFEDHR